MTPRQIIEPAQLLVEGAIPERLITEQLQHIGKNGVQVQDFGGVNEFRGFVKGLVSAPRFHEIVRAVAVIRDAEGGDAAGAFQSVSDALTHAGLVAPPQMRAPSNGQVVTSIFVLPDCASAGMLETLCFNSVTDDPAVPCVDGFFACAAAAGLQAPHNTAKARIQAFLSTRRQFTPSIAVAAVQGVWNWDHPAWADLTNFLNAI